MQYICCERVYKLGAGSGNDIRAKEKGRTSLDTGDPIADALFLSMSFSSLLVSLLFFLVVLR